MTHIVIACVWLLGDRRREALRSIWIGALGAIIGYFIAFVYFYVTRDEGILSLLDLSVIGLLVGGGYSIIVFFLLPKKVRLVGID
jgi:hypothetical protein